MSSHLTAAKKLFDPRDLTPEDTLQILDGTNQAFKLHHREAHHSDQRMSIRVFEFHEEIATGHLYKFTYEMSESDLSAIRAGDSSKIRILSVVREGALPTKNLWIKK